MCGNTNEIGDVSVEPGKSSLFFLTLPWNRIYPAIRLYGGKALIFCCPVPFDGP